MSGEVMSVLSLEGQYYTTWGAGATGAARAAAFVAQTVLGKQGGRRFPFLQELYFKTRMLLT